MEQKVAIYIVPTLHNVKALEQSTKEAIKSSGIVFYKTFQIDKENQSASHEDRMPGLDS